MADPEMLQRLAARRVELDGLEEQLAGQLEQVRIERDELAVAERVWARMSEQIAAGSAPPPAAGPVAVRAVGEHLGLQVEVRGKLEPLRGKLSKLADRGWLRKLPDGRFTA